MKLNNAVLSRRNIRAFLSDPVPREKIVKILEITRWAPSWGNIQPWEIVVADGEKTKSLSKDFYLLPQGTLSDFCMNVQLHIEIHFFISVPL